LKNLIERNINFAYLVRKMELRWMLALALVGAACAQQAAEGKDLDALIRSVFTSPPPPTGGAGRDNDQFRGSTTLADQQLSCTCVPYYLCQNGTIKTDGEGVIDIR
jgi:hypothetical protein